MTTKVIEFQLQEPIDVLLYQRGRIPVEAVLKSLIVYHEEISVFEVGKYNLLTTDKVKSKRTTTGRVLYDQKDTPIDFDSTFDIVAPGLVVENCYLQEWSPTSTTPAEFLAGHVRADPKYNGTVRNLHPSRKTPRWYIMEEFDAIAKREPLWPGDLISKKRAKILEDARLVKRDKDGNVILTPNGRELAYYWRALPEEY